MYSHRLYSAAFAALIAFACTARAQDAAEPLNIDHNQYKMVHRLALYAVETGRAAEARDQLLAYGEKHPEDAETRFALAIAYAQLGELDKGWAAVQEAVALGMPPTRFVAGPRTWLGPLADHRDFASFVAAHNGGVVHGPLVGSVTDSGAAIWVRTGTERDVAVRYRVDSGAGEWRTSAAVRSAADADYTALVRLDGLAPTTSYAYEILLDGAPAADLDRLTFRTFPAAGSPASFRIAFGGGAGYTPRHERAWHAVAAAKPDALVMLGDNVYIDHPESPGMQRYKYYRRQSRSEWRALTGRVPVFAIYDDHDFGDNDCWGGPEIETPAWKRPVWKYFTRNWANPSYGGGDAQPGCWFQYSIADVDVFMLDGRYYRTGPDDAQGKDRTMLGPVQKRWLLDALGKSKATFKVLVSPVPWASGSKPGSPDTWDGYPEERAEIFDFLRDERINGVVLLSSDRHRSDLWRTDHPGLYPLYEFNSAQFTNEHTHEEMPNAEFSYNRKQSFGLIDFDTTLDDPTVRYTIATIDGEQVFRRTFALSELRVAADE